jgi:putative tricarboxylic transport membrane protein
MRGRMNLFEQAYNLIWILAAIWICIRSARLNLWGPSGPETGFFPFVAGLLIGICGVLLFASEMSKGSGKKSERKFWEHPDTWKRTCYVILGFFVMAALMPILGFLPTAVPVMTLLVFLIKPQKIVKVIVTAVLSCSFLYLFFNYIFELKLPKGLLGF